MNIFGAPNSSGPEPRCNICNKRIATYFCNKCNVILCSKCVKESKKKFYYCVKCGEKISFKDVTNRTKKLKCSKCKSTTFKEGISREKVCPSCHHTLIVTIAEKERSFVETFRKQVMGLMDAHEELYSIRKRVKAAKKNLTELRSDGYLHDRQLETITIDIINALPLFQEKILLKLGQKLGLLQVQVQKLSYLDRWGPQNFAYYDTILKQIKDNLSLFHGFVAELLENPKKDLEYVVEKTKELLEFKELFTKMHPSFTLLPGELPVAIFSNVKIKECNIEKVANQTGYLIFTDQRLIFMKKKGLISRKLENTFEMFLDGFEKIAVVGRLLKRIRIETDSGMIKFAAKKINHMNILKYFSTASNFAAYQVSDKLMTALMDASDLSCNLNELKEKIEYAISHLQNLFDRNMNLNNARRRPEPIQEFQATTPFPRPQDPKPLYYFNSQNIQFPTLNNPSPLPRPQSPRYGSEKNVEIEEQLLNLQKRKFMLEEDLKALEQQVSLESLGFRMKEEYLQRLHVHKEELRSLNRKIESIERRIRIEEEKPVALPLQLFE